ncbi:Flagellar hook-associated protein 2 [compost metagenome]
MVTRVNGFSGMDIDSMVKSMMAAKRVPLDKLNQDKQLLQWQREGYRELNSKLYDFRTNKLITKYGGNAALNAQKAVVSGNTTAVKAEALATATGVDMKVSVTQLATRTTYETPGLGQGKPATMSLAALDGVDLSSLSATDRTEYLKKGFDISINGETFKDKDGKSIFNGLTSISTLVATINSSSKANAIASYDEITGKLTIASKTSGKDGIVTMGTPASSNTLLGLFSKSNLNVVESNKLTGVTTATTVTELINKRDGTSLVDADVKDIKFTINGKELVVKGSDSITTIMNTINGAGAKVNASFTTDGTLKLVGDSGGDVILGGDSYEFMKLFNGRQSTPADDNSIKKTIDGVNAKVSINDVEIDNVNSNTFTINGVQLTLQELTKKDAASADVPVIIKTQTDPDKAVETIKGFIEDYNSLVVSLNAKIDEAKYRDFRPLTDEQKSALKDDDIKTWTEKAKSGLLKNDDIIKSVLSEMRAIITEKLGPLSTLGITTGNYMENGKLVIKDEAKLKNAISANPQLAMDILQGPASAPKEGIMDKMADKISAAIDKISERAGTNRFSMDLTSTFKEESVMGKKMKLYNTRITSMLTMLNNAETRYYKQFSAMETAMNKLQSQSNSLFSTSG